MQSSSRVYTDKPSRIERARNGVALLHLSFRFTWDVAGREWLRTNRKQFLHLPKHQRRLFEYTCQHCSPLIERWGKYPKRGLSMTTWMDVGNLTRGCVNCEMIQQMYAYFIDGPSRKPVKIVIRDWERTDFTRLDFFPQTRLIIGSPPLGEDHVHVQIYAQELNNRRNFFPHLQRTVCVNPTAADMVRKINDWISQCVEKHSICTATDTSYRLPKRLIEITRSIRLVTPSEPVRFTALTYCWGKSEQPKTVKANARARFEGFSYENLPQTIRDAIYLTRQLGIDYIWVDSLCIVQDDREDWAAESVKMADIYTNAFLVLAATRAGDVSDGFLQPRKEPCRIILGREGHKFAVAARRINNHDCTDRIDLDHLPLSKRGWCMQERMLARRILHFLDDETLYQCGQGSCCECGLSSGSSNRHVMWPPVLKQGGDPTEFAWKWGQVAQYYSRLDFTKPEDALPALSGLAQRTLHLNPGAYFAGIWEKDIIYHLCWYRDFKPYKRARARVLKSPTFSWITCPSPVAHADWGGGTPVCTFRSGQNVLSTIDPLGRVLYTCITLCGRVVPGNIFASAILDRGSSIHGDKDFDWENDWVPTSRVYIDSGHAFYQSGLVDEHPLDDYKGLDRVLQWDTISCLALMCSDFDGTGLVILLLLRFESHVNSYRRVGLAEHVHQAWFDAYAEDRTATII